MDVDLEVIAKRRSISENLNKDIYSGPVIIDSDSIVFEPIKLFDGKLEIMLPREFNDLPAALRRIKYPSEDRPTVIKSNDDSSVNFAFAVHDIAVNNDSLEGKMKGYANSLYRMNIGIAFYNTEVVPVGDSVFGYFDFASKGINSTIYQLFGFMPFYGEMLQFIFNCPVEYKDAWFPVVLQVIASLGKLEQ